MNKELNWLETKAEALDAINMLQSKFMDPPALVLPQPHRPYLIDTNTSPCALGAVLLQQQNNNNLN